MDITEKRLLGKDAALITGGNSGIDLAVARLFVAEGADVAIVGSNQKNLRAAAAELGDTVLSIQADVTDIVAIEHALVAAAEEFGKVDIVFANAGIGAVTPVGQTSLATFDEVIRTNLMAVLTLTTLFFTMQAAATHLEAGASVILNSSVHAAMGVPGFSAYGAVKAGVRAMTRSLASKFAPRGIRVNQVTPGGTATPFWSQSAPTDEAMAALEQRITRSIPPGRMDEADEVAKAVLYLASDDASNVTGAEIVVAGGATGVPRGAPINGTK
jgi:NAD(P)-dependent dehydrogenase (short-subunit alcohol dehydrogenase family)